jgi:hypothetical protein
LLLVIGLVLMFIATRNRGNRSVSFLSTERRVE